MYWSLVGVSHETIIDWNNFCRSICLFKASADDQVGRPGLDVQIDESLMCMAVGNGSWMIRTSLPRHLGIECILVITEFAGLERVMTLNTVLTITYSLNLCSVKFSA